MELTWIAILASLAMGRVFWSELEDLVESPEETPHANSDQRPR
jgi:hypothetical protein